LWIRLEPGGREVMAEAPYDLQLKLQRSGWFDARRVDGWQYEDERGQLAWHIRTWLEGGDRVEDDREADNGVEDYWVEGGEFYEVVEIHLVNELPKRIETGRKVTGIDAAKRSGILKTIAEWARPIETKAL
jgi:hypothetical protein